MLLIKKNVFAKEQYKLILFYFFHFFFLTFTERVWWYKAGGLFLVRRQAWAGISLAQGQVAYLRTARGPGFTSATVGLSRLPYQDLCKALGLCEARWDWRLHSFGQTSGPGLFTALRTSMLAPVLAASGDSLIQVLLKGPVLPYQKTKLTCF